MSLFSKASLIITPNAYKGGISQGTLYSIVPNDGSNDFAVQRASTATRVNSNGLLETVANNVIRIDYMNNYPTILTESSGTNLNKRSNEFSNVFYTKQGTTATASSTDFTTSAKAFLLAETAVTGLHRCYSSDATIFKTSFLKYTTSCFFKKGSGAAAPDIVRLVTGSTLVNFANFNITTGTVLYVSTGVTASITPYSNGWYRCSITAFPGAATTLEQIQFTNNTNSTAAPNSITYAGDVNRDVFIAGLQSELGDIPTTYIPTIASTVTRISDRLAMTALTAKSFFIDFNYNINAPIGGFLLTFVYNYFTYLAISDNKVYLDQYYNDDGNFITISSIADTTNLLPRNKAAFKYYDTGGGIYRMKLFVNGVLIGEASDPIYADSFYTNDIGALNNTINSVLYFDEVLTDQELINLTTIS